jgi:rhodanese-related sulfurtransferase
MLNLGVKEFSEKITEEGVRILDVRTPDEISEGYIEGAQFVDFYHEDFKIEIDSLNKEFAYAIYCRSGKRSSQAMEIMQEFGFENLYNLEGGIIEWTNAGMPVVSS